MKPANLGKAALVRCLAVGLAHITLIGLAWGETPELASNGRKPAGGRQIQQLIEQLGDLSFETREQASSRLAEIGPEVLAIVVEATRSTDPEVCLRSWRLIELWSGQGDVPSLLTQLQSRSPSTRATAADSLSKVEPRPLTAVPGLIEATDDPIDFVRVSAREALKKIQETNGLRIEFQETAERVEVGGQTVIRMDVTNCGKEPVDNIRLTARVPAQLVVLGAQGGNRPVQHEALAGRLLTEPFRLEANATLRWEVTSRAAMAGEARFKIELTADGLPHPLIEEKVMPIVTPMPKPEQPMNP